MVEAKSKKGRRCPECGNREVIFDYQLAEEVCGVCGAVISDHGIDRGPEWRAYTHEEFEKKARTGPFSSYRYPDKGLSTEISKPGRKITSPSKRARFSRLRKWDRRAKVSPTLREGLNELQRIGSRMGLSENVIESAARVYRRAVEMKLTKGYGISSTAAAVIYLTLRDLYNLPRPLTEVVRESGLEKKEVSKCIRRLRERLEDEFKSLRQLPSEVITHYIPRIVSELGLPMKVTKRAVELYRKARESRLTAGKDPLGMSAAFVYIASVLEGEKIAQGKIARNTGISEVTLRNRYKEIWRKLNLPETL